MAFWAYSNELYARPDVAHACLALQDDHGFDVNLLLLCAWLAERDRRALDPRDIDVLRGAVTEWMAEVVVPLRGVRGLLKQSKWESVAGSSGRSCRERVKRAELDSERVAQELLVRSIPNGPEPSSVPPRNLAARSLWAYTEVLKEPSAAGLISQLVAAIFASADAPTPAAPSEAAGPEL